MSDDEKLSKSTKLYEPPISILLVDDNAKNLLALAALLEDMGYQLVKAFSGKDALEQVLKQDFALILLDVQMPGMDGFETARLIQGMTRARHTPIIFVTAIHYSEEYQSKGYRAGAVDYLYKPIDATVLRAKVQVFVDLYRQTQKEKQQREIEEKKSAEHQARINNILESITDGFVAFDREWHFTYLNRATEDPLTRLGKTREELIGKIIWDEFPDLIGSELYTQYQYAVTQQQSITFQYYYPRLELWYEFHAYPSNEGLSVYFKDITARKRAEEDLKNQRKWLEEMLNLAPIPIMLIEPGTSNVTFANKAADRLAVSTHLYESPAHRTQYFFTDAEESSLPDDQTPIARAARGERLRGLEVNWHTPLGKQSLLIFADPLPEMHEQPPTVALVFQDITEIKQVEAELRRASQMKDEFLATVSHELRTPLQAILGWTKLLRSGKLDENAYARALETIERNAKTQAQIIEDILDVSHIIRGNLRLNVRPIELVPVIWSAVDIVRPAANAKNIKLKLVLDPTAGQISGDPDRLRQVIWNLLSNAVKFTPQGGNIEIRLEHIGAQVEIAVCDTGKGINVEFLPYVFDRFRQADSTITRRHGGLGLGLAIARHLVELHGGTIQVESAGEDQGATFSVKLPRLGMRESALKQTFKQVTHPLNMEFDCPPELEGMRVLVVEDDPDTRELITAVLQQCGAKVRACGSVTEALEMLDQWHPDVLLSDIGMPEEDGYDLIRKIRERQQQGKTIPAAALTAFTTVEDRLRALSAGFQEHIPKPVEPGQLAAIVASLSRKATDNPGEEFNN
ncbi:MAG: response regulator [Acidobacteriota bacterium]